MTPRLTAHARERCAQMGIKTRIAKRIVQHADVRRPSRGVTIATSDRHPLYAVAYVATDDGPLVVSVLFRTEVEYIRDGENFVAVPALTTPTSIPRVAVGGAA